VTNCPDLAACDMEFLTDIEALIKFRDDALEVLCWYANPKKYSDQKPGDVREFGCGCCAGIVIDDGTTDFNTSVQGQRAREFLETIHK